MTHQHFSLPVPIAGAGEARLEALSGLYRQIQSMYPLEEPDWALFQQKVRWEIRPKGALLLSPGEVCDCVRFLHSGAVIQYDGVDEEQQLEQVGWIAQPGEMVLEINSFFQCNPTQVYLKCTADCAFLTLPYADLQALYFESPAWNTVGRLLAEEYMLLMAERTHVHKLNSALEKYRYFVQRFPEALQLVSQRHIAAFLRIRPETLSRLRARRVAHC